ncbi:MAG: c-type cytochrome [Dehalococcoidia bacterium]
MKGWPARQRFLFCGFLGATLAALILVSACGTSVGGVPSPQVAGGDAADGKGDMQRYGCGSCHVIPGVPNAKGYAGPPLNAWARRGTIAGLLSNQPDNLEHWLQDPQSVVPGNVMPNMGVTEQDAKDMAAYLYTLK